MSRLFKVGRLVATPGALATLEDAEADLFHLLLRHSKGDWGDLDREDKLANDNAIVHGTRLLSAYILANKEKIWILTEADRSSTCVLLPSEY